MTRELLHTASMGESYERLKALLICVALALFNIWNFIVLNKG